MEPKEKYYSMKAYKVIQAMKRRNFEAFYCETKEDALKKCLEMIEEGSTVSWGGSSSIKEIGLTEALKSGNYTCFDRDMAKDTKEKEEIVRKAFSSDYFLMSSNAVTLDGKLVNIDGNGNRIAALAYGPRNVIIVVGMNKVTADKSEAISRVSNIAAPINAMRLKTNTPCATSGSCSKCKEDECICSHTIITRMSKIKDRIKVVLVREDLGF